MSELVVRPTKSGQTDADDLLEAFTDEQISWANVQPLCNLRSAGFNSSGYRPADSLADRYLALSQQYRFQVTATGLERTDLQSDVTELVETNASVIAKDINRRLRHDARPIFGEDGAQHWYGGKVLRDNATLDAVWAMIQEHSAHEKPAKMLWPASTIEKRHNLFLKSNRITEAQRGVMISALANEAGIVAKRACTIDWRALTPLGSLRDHVTDPFIEIEARHLWAFMHEEIVNVKGFGQMINLDILKAEIVNDPLVRNYSAMTDAEVAASLNTKDRSIVVEVGSRQLLEWAATNGRLIRVKRAGDETFVKANLPQLSATDQDKLIAAAGAAYLMLTRGDTAYHPTKHNTLTQVLVSAGVLSATDKSDLDALGNVTGSRAQELGMGEIFPSYVDHVRTHMIP